MTDPLAFLTNLLTLTGRTAFALAAAGATLLILRSYGVVEFDTWAMWIAYVGLVGASWIVANASISAYRAAHRHWRDRPDYGLLSQQRTFEIRDAAKLLAGVKPTMQGNHETVAWENALRDSIHTNRIEFIEYRGGKRIGPRPDWSDSVDRASLAKAIKALGKRVPRWVK